MFRLIWQRKSLRFSLRPPPSGGYHSKNINYFCCVRHLVADLAEKIPKIFSASKGILKKDSRNGEA